MTSSHRPYQGYPYVDPPVTDAPSITAVAAARWNNLPRRQLETSVRREPPPPAHVHLQERFGSSIPSKRENNPAPVVYIELPAASGSDVSDRRLTDGHDIEDIESPSSHSQESKADPDAPVVYIDLPEDNGSYVARSRELTPNDDQPAFVQDTIFYDQFENRRIDRAKDESDDDSEVSGSSTRPRAPARRPNTLDLNGAGTSAGASSSYHTSSSGMSSLMAKEAELYGRTDSNGFPASPIPVSHFPEPPPAYAEIDHVSSPVVDREPVVDQPRAPSPPRTQVILPRDVPTTPIGMPNSERKYLNCHHCGMRVHTLVIRENGTITHVTGLSCLMICMLPAVYFIYSTDYLKIKNHYCPSCNKIIGYELPFSSNKIVYVN